MMDLGEFHAQITSVQSKLARIHNLDAAVWVFEYGLQSLEQALEKVSLAKGLG